jgi:predicted component of viral defense system (DUF524 family)
MIVKPDAIQVEFYDDDGNRVSAMDLYAETDGTGPFTISPEDAAENSEARVQLLEAAAYEYQVRDRGFRLREEPGIVRPSRARSEPDRGRIMPGLNVGRLRFALLDAAGKQIGSAGVEIRAAKINYRDEYRRMLEYITDRCTDLLLEFRSPAEQTVLPEEAREPETLCQRFAFVRSLITSRRFRDAVQRVIALPHRLCKQEEHEVSLGRDVKPSASVARQIASASRRLPLPSDHPFVTRMSSVPSRVTVLRNVETVDTPENRFMKHVLSTFQAFAANIRERLERQVRESDAGLIEESLALEEELGEVLSRDFFRAVSDPEILPLGSPVLQRKGGYREILAAWLQFDMAARLCWAGGAEVYGAGKRDVATLYEYWLFFKLIEVVADIFDLEQPPAKSLIEPTEDGFGLKLRSGRHIPLEGEYNAEGGGRKLKVRFSYNRTFPRRGPDAERNFPVAGSWTERMRPDYTLTLWPAGFTEDEAEKQEVIVHVHFDAKYRVKDVPEIFGDTDDKFTDEAALEKDLAADKVLQREGRYRRGDLLKMHAYRDAIRRTAGAYVLYPGTEARNWRGFHEIVPGLGAFGIRPCEEGDDGTPSLKDFILQVVNHVCDRATRREQETYHRYRIQDPGGPPPQAVCEAPLPEYDIYGRRVKPPRETPILVAWYQNEVQLGWSQDKGMVIVRMDDRPGSLSLTTETVGACYILLHTEGCIAAPGLLAIKPFTGSAPAGPRVITARTLKTKYKYPLPTHSRYYIVYRVENAPDFEHVQWNIRKLLELKDIPAGRASALPFTVFLDELMQCCNLPG